MTTLRLPLGRIEYGGQQQHRDRPIRRPEPDQRREHIELGNVGGKKDAQTIRIGDQAIQRKAFIAGISGVTIPSGAAVMINSKGQLGVSTSSARYKEKIEPMAQASEAILSLQPVTFQYKKELDAAGTPQFGLVAEEVAKVDPDLVVRDGQDQPYTVRYEAVNAMLLNEFLKEHRRAEQQSEKIEALESAVAKVEAAVREQALQIQQVRARAWEGAGARAQVVARRP